MENKHYIVNRDAIYVGKVVKPELIQLKGKNDNYLSSI